MLRAGTLNSRVRIERRYESTDPAGSVRDTWVEVSTVWANIRYVNGREFAAGGGQAQQSTVSIRVRFTRGLTAGMRVIHEGTVYAVVAVLPDMQRREHVDLACTTGANLG